MTTSLRFDRAIEKLYTAFHHSQLHPECNNQCAVGNILDRTDSWKHLSDLHGSLQLNYIGLVHQNLGRKFNGYSPLELLGIEASFLKGCGYVLPLNHKNPRPKNPTDNTILFNGLSEVVKQLCKLDDIPNIMDYTSLFNFEVEMPLYKLETSA